LDSSRSRPASTGAIDDDCLLLVSNQSEDTPYDILSRKFITVNMRRMTVCSISVFPHGNSQIQGIEKSQFPFP
jgi:hypothetical protein